MIVYIYAYMAALIAFVAIDAVWLGLIARRFYVDQIGHLMAERPALAVASVFYLIYLLGIVVFAVTPGLETGSPNVAAFYGAFFGLCAYATYEVTNYVTLRNWPLQMVVIDTLWGAVLSAATAYIATLVALRFV